MKHRLLSPLPVLVVLLCAVVLVLGVSVWQRHGLTNDSRALAVTVTQAVLSTGDATALLARAHEELLALRSPESLGSYINDIPLSLGPLQAINSISGGAEVALVTGLGEPYTASYELSLSFSRSEATAFVDLRQVDGGWQFTRFRVDAPLLYN